MSDGELYTVCVFQDVSWAQRAIDALLADDFSRDWLSILAKDTEPAATFIQTVLGGPPVRMEVKDLGTVVGRGALLEVLRGNDDGLSRAGLARTFNRVGFQPHDGHIYETLTGRGGVLVAVRSEPRAADALAKMHAYGGGNAAIGAYGGRV